MHRFRALRRPIADHTHRLLARLERRIQFDPNAYGPRQKLAVRIEILEIRRIVRRVGVDPRDQGLPLVLAQRHVLSMGFIVQQRKDQPALVRAELFWLRDFRSADVARQAE